jgi:hypothetical protein
MMVVDALANENPPFQESSNNLSMYKEIANPVPIENTAEISMIKDKYKAIVFFL